MALLIRNQAAFVEQIARNDQERVALRDWQHKTQVWQGDIEVALSKMQKTILQNVLEELPKIIVRDVLDKLPKAVKKEIGFKSHGNR